MITQTKINTTNKNRLYTSASVFTQLYNSHKSIKDVLAIFIDYVIQKYKLSTFTTTRIKEYLNKEFLFEVPESVIKSILKRRLYYSVENGLFIKIPKQTRTFSNEEIDTQISNSSVIIGSCLSQLFEYIQNHIEEKLEDEDKQEILSDLYEIILNKDYSNKYTDLISGYLLKIESEVEKVNVFQEIKEGIIIYEGLKTTDNLDDIFYWKNNLDIYCDVDILFSYYGFNGAIYKNLIQDLIELINKVNKKHIKVHLKYFTKTKAEMIVENNEKPNPTKTAMIDIVNGCSSIADILLKKKEFFSFLKKNNITEYEGMNSFYDDEENHKYVLLSEDTKQKVFESSKAHKDVDLNYISECSEYIDYINALRDGNTYKMIDQCKSIFLSSNFTLHKLTQYCTNHNDIPFSIHPENLINLLWFKLNSGLGNQKISTFSIVSKSRILLSAHINNKINDEYDKLVERYKESESDQNVIKDLLSEILQKDYVEDKLKSSNIEAALDLLMAEDLYEERISLNHILEEKNKQKDAIISEKNLLITKKDDEIQKYHKNIEELEKSNINIENENIKIKTIVNRQAIELEELRKEKQKAQLKKFKRKTFAKCSVKVLITFVVLGLLVFLAKKFEVSNKILTFIGAISGILTILCFFGIDYKKAVKFYIDNEVEIQGE